MKRNDSIQILRGIAALLVVHVHTILAASPHAIPYEVHLFHLAGVGACGVDIFFTISGFILSTVAMSLRPTEFKVPNTALDFLVRRFIRIFPIYWILSLFFVLIQLKRHRLILSSFLNSYLLLPTMQFPIPAPLLSFGWTLIFEMFFYYLITLNLFLGARRVVERTILTILVFIALGGIMGLQQPIVVLIANPINLEFVFGCVIGLLFVRYGKRHTLGTVLLLGGALTFAVTGFFNQYAFEASNVVDGSLSWHRVLIWGVPAAMVTAGLVFRFTHIRSLLGRFGVLLGDASYSVYLISMPVLFLFNRLYPQLAGLGPDTNAALALLAVAVSGLLCYRFVEKPLLLFLTTNYHHPAMHLAHKHTEPTLQASDRY